MTCSQLIKVLLTLPLVLVNFRWHHQALSLDATNQRSSLTPALEADWSIPAHAAKEQAPSLWAQVLLAQLSVV